MCTQTEDQSEREEKIKAIITDFKKRFDNKELTGMLDFCHDDTQ